MGVETEIGCLGCKKYIWLGSMKAYKWKGFQIPNRDVFRFLSLHSNNNNPNCKLIYTHDANETDFPWKEEVDINKEWQEDINSRSFWDSYSKEGVICGNCEKLLKDKSGNEITHHIGKNSYSWFCNDICFESYKKNYGEKWNTKIYDSTDDEGVLSNSENLEIGCNQCKTYTIIDEKKDDSGIIKDYEYFHLFLTEHSFHKNLIVFIGNDIKNKPPWKNEISNDVWIEYID